MPIIDRADLSLPWLNGRQSKENRSLSEEEQGYL